MPTDLNSSVASVICGGVFLIVLVLPVFLLSRLLKIEHDDFYEQWEKDGNPHGAPFWFPMKEGRIERLGVGPWSRGYLWLFKTPDWVKGHQGASKMLRYYRLVSYIIYLGLFATSVLVLLVAPR